MNVAASTEATPVHPAVSVMAGPLSAPSKIHPGTRDAGKRLNSPIGSARGLNNPYGLASLRAHFPDVTLIVDAGLGRPSHAAAALESGYDGVLLNTAVARAGDPAAMARAFGLAVEAGRLAFEAGALAPRDMAAPSTPVFGTAMLA